MFICKYCNAEYKFNTNLVRHIKLKHFDINKDTQKIENGKKFNCNICNKNFSSNEYLKIHTLKCKTKNTEIITHQINNNNNNNNLIIAPVQNNTIINNIVINTLGNENMAKLTHNEIDRIFDDEINGIITCVDYIYFNKNAPENHIFCTLKT